MRSASLIVKLDENILMLTCDVDCVGNGRGGVTDDAMSFKHPCLSSNIRLFYYNYVVDHGIIYKSTKNMHMTFGKCHLCL